MWLIEKLRAIQTRTPFIHQIGRWCEEQLLLQEARDDVANLEQEGLAAEFNMIRQLEVVKRRNQEKLQNLCRRCGSIPDDPFLPEVRVMPVQRSGLCGRLTNGLSVDMHTAKTASNPASKKSERPAETA